ncbi:S-adenosyl-L-methionine-dependent methyltransferase [Xylariomycetidae sp. FL2044]|nr:S-adenosyl-L-methionine-dependent methyltransferase [Xylariomycetidae sp. FL2044]
MAQSRIVELSSRIAANTAILDGYLAENKLAAPSFDLDGPRDSLVPKTEAGIERARIALIDDTAELRALALGPREYLMSNSHNDVLSLQAITRFRLAHLIPVGAEVAFSEIAQASGLREATVRQVLRHAVVMNIFCEPRPGLVAHNAASRLLLEDQTMHDWAGANTNELWQAAAHTCEAWERYPRSEEPNETGFSVANQTDKSIYEVFAQRPERARRLGNAMTSFTKGAGFELRHVVDSIPWEKYQDGRVVDVGGSTGIVCFAVARAHPSISFVVQDQEPVVAAARLEVPADVAGRVEFMVHDFLTEQPVRGADVYLFRWIFHNWPDKYCVQILRNLIPALKPGAKIIVNDNVLPKPGTIPKMLEKRIRAVDLTMAEIQNSHEREVQDWIALFRLADKRFEFKEAKQPEGSILWILTVEWTCNNNNN